MKAVVWHSQRDVRVETVADPSIVESTDAVIRVTSSGLCGSDLHLYEVLSPFMAEGDILGHEPIGVVEETGRSVTHVSRGDRVVVPFNISCGSCQECNRKLYSQCETTQVRKHGTGAALFGYTELYGQVPGGQAEFLRVPQAHFGLIKVPAEGPDDRYVYLSDVLPTAWQAVEYANVPRDGSLAILGLGPIGQMCVRIARHRGIHNVIGVDLVAERINRAEKSGARAIDLMDRKDVVEALRAATDGRGPDSVIDAVGMEAHGSPVGKLAQRISAMLPQTAARQLTRRAGIDRMAVLHAACRAVCRGGTVSVSGVYGGAQDPMPLMEIFDRQIQLRFGQANVRRWTDEILPLLTTDDDPLGVDQFATHRVPLDQAPQAYEMFQNKRDGAVKILFKPGEAVGV